MLECKGTGNEMGEIGKNRKKNKEMIIWFMCRSFGNKYWVFMRINDIYGYGTKLLMDII